MTNSIDSIQVWVLFNHYHPNFSGAAIQGHRVLRELVRKGFTVTVLAAGDRDALSLRGKEIRRDGIAIRYLPVLPRRSWRSLTDIPFLRKMVVFLNSLASNFSLAHRSAWMLWRKGHLDDIVQIYGGNEFSFIPAWVAHVRGMHPAIHMTLLGSDDPESISEDRGTILGGLELESFRRAEVIVGYSSALANSCYSAGFDSRKVVLIPGGADTTLFYPLDSQQKESLRTELGLKTGQRYIVSVGAAVFRKGIDVLIRAFIEVAQHHSDVRLLVVGPNDFTDISRYLPKRQQFLEELRGELLHAGYSSQVQWIGKVENVHEYLQAADIFCLPTRQEGFGIVIAEAMAVGLPIVTAHLEGVTTDLISKRSEGILIPDHDPRLYADALMHLLRDPAMAASMGGAARDRAESEFNLEIVGQRFAGLYRDLAAASHA